MMATVVAGIGLVQVPSGEHDRFPRSSVCDQLATLYQRPGRMQVGEARAVPFADVQDGRASWGIDFRVLLGYN
jgi:hypothetical protein